LLGLIGNALGGGEHGYTIITGREVGLNPKNRRQFHGSKRGELMTNIQSSPKGSHNVTYKGSTALIPALQRIWAPSPKSLRAEV